MLTVEQSRVSKRLRIVALIGAVALVLSGVQLLSPTAAQAADARDFDAGSIISDTNFYNGSAMTAGEIQAFLNQRLSSCRIGKPPYMPGWTSPSGTGNTIASACLKDFRQTTSSRNADSYCRGYVGRQNESSAEIIAKVGAACGISPKVLLVMLEKEQSLLTDDWPVTRQYNYALGMNCPDSGPDNSANCDTSSAGFALQLYLGARQLKVYRANPSYFKYRPFQMNTIQWNPNTRCGASQVYIENWATAALYIYTPYRPNQAALDAQWGTGDGCSSYGNRNFYMFYSTWFSPPAGEAFPQIDAAHARNPWLGAALGEYSVKTAPSPGVVRAYENGAITWKRGSANAFVLSGGFRSYYGTQGGLTGRLGWPASDQGDRERGKTQGFDGGALSWNPSSGFVTVSGQIRTHYANWALAYGGPLGWPLADQTCTANDQCTQRFELGSITLKNGVAAISIPAIDAVAATNSASLGPVTQTPMAQTANGGGFVQAHRNGAIAWSQSGGAHIVSGAIRTAFGETGGISGSYGWPTSDQSCDASRNCSQSFSGGIIQVDASGKASRMAKVIKDAYDALRASGQDLGRSLGDTAKITAGRGGLVHAFERGAITASDRTGAFAVTAPIRIPFNAAGGLAGPLGWPVGAAKNETAGGGGSHQDFEGGTLATSRSGSFVLSGAIRTAFTEHGGVTGSLGWPVSNVITQTVGGGGTVQAFQGGALTLQKGASTPFKLDREIRRVFGEAGGLAGLPGWPLSNARAEAGNGGGTVQGFQNAAITSSPAGTFVISGEIRKQFNALGGLKGELGWPVSAMALIGGEYQQSFQTGTIFWEPQTNSTRVERNASDSRTTPDEQGTSDTSDSAG